MHGTSRPSELELESASDSELVGHLKGGVFGNRVATRSRIGIRPRRAIPALKTPISRDTAQGPVERQVFLQTEQSSLVTARTNLYARLSSASRLGPCA